jgi:fucose permease
LGYQIGAILGGALAPTIAVMLWNTYGVVYVSVYMAMAAVATITCVSLLTETSGNELD